MHNGSGIWRLHRWRAAHRQQDAQALRAKTRSRTFRRCAGRYDEHVRFKGRVLQLPADRHRCHYAKVRVKVRRHANGDLSVWHGPRKLAIHGPSGERLSDGELPIAA